MAVTPRVVAGEPGRPVAVVLPGSGSCADFVRRAFGAAVVAAGHALVSADPEPGAGVVDAAFETLDRACRDHEVALVGGVSLGAHVAARWAATRCARRGGPGDRLAGLLLALPAWTGDPGPVGAASARAAAELRTEGVGPVLARARRHAVPWVGDELALAWPAYGDVLADTLEAAASSPGPTPAQLAGLRLPAGVAAFEDDPLHPLAVAERWAGTLPRCALERLPLARCSTDRGALGGAAVAAWLRAAAGG